MFALIIAFLQESVVFQVLLLVQGSLAMTCWVINSRPMIDRESNAALITNELVILVGTYLILLFSGYVPTAEDEYKFGYMFLAVFSLVTAVNVIVFLVISIKEIIRSIKTWRAKKAV